jgi:hypothetical protein
MAELPDKAAHRDLRGGCAVMRIPTAIQVTIAGKKHYLWRDQDGFVLGSRADAEL